MDPSIIPLPPNRVRRNYLGGAGLDALEGAADPRDSDQPEDWIASTVPARNPGLPDAPGEGVGFVPDGTGEWIAFPELLRRDPERLLGADRFKRNGANLGFLVKLLDSSMRLHVQAHPTAEFACRHLNSQYGKLETYYVLGVRDDVEPYIRLGFQRLRDADEWRRIVFEQDVAAMDRCFDRVPVRPGESWFIPGGLPHAIGPGLTVIEVLEPTDLVVRCEFEREGIVVPPPARFMGRDPDLMMEIFDCSERSVPEITDACRTKPEKIREFRGFVEERLIGVKQTTCFEIRKWTVSETIDVPLDDRFDVCVVAEGSGSVGVEDVTIDVHRGSKFFLAAAADQLRCEPEPGEGLIIVRCSPGASSE